jgi:tellurium resistance protein TerD
MAINLKKGQRISLTKDDPSLSKIMVGLGWDPVKKSGGGLLAGLFGGGAPDIDCDASVFMLDENGKIKSKENIIYFGNLKSRCGSVKHSGDNLTGGGAGDDEQIFIELPLVPRDVHKLVFVVNIYNCVKRKQHFGMVENAFIRLVNLSGNKEILRYSLTNEYSGKTALNVAEIYRQDNEWKFAAIGQGTNDASLGDMSRAYL